MASRADETVITIRNEDHCPKTTQENTKQETAQDSSPPGDPIEIKKPRENKSGLQRIKEIVEWGSLVIIMAWLVASLVVQKLGKPIFWDVEMWKWCVLTLAFFCGRLVSSWLIRVILYFYKNSECHREIVVYYAEGLRHSVQVFVWLVFVLFIWLILLDGSFNQSRFSSDAPDFVARTLGSLIIGSFFWILKSSLLTYLKSKFNIDAFLDKILETILSEVMLKKLSKGPSEKVEDEKKSIEMNEKKCERMREILPWIRTKLIKISEEKEEDKKKTIGRNELKSLKKMREIPPWTTTELIQMVLAPELHLKSDEDFDEDVKKAAERIMENIAPQSAKKNISEKDLSKFLSPEEVEDLKFFEKAEETGAIESGAVETRAEEIKAVETGVEETGAKRTGAEKKVARRNKQPIKRQNFENWVHQAYDNHRELACILRHIKNAVHDLNKILTPVLLVVTLITWVLLARIATTKVLLFISSQLLLAAFMFGNTLKTVFESIIFVFVMHPFNLGDRCVVDGIQMMVVEMNIFSTVFLKLNKEKVYYPNSVLATKPISNYFRSPDMTDAVELLIETTADTIGLVKKKIDEYFLANLGSWHPSYELLVKENEMGNRIKMVLCCKHKKNFQDFKQKNRRRTELVVHVKEFLEAIQQQKEKENEKEQQTTPPTPPAPLPQVIVIDKSSDTAKPPNDAPLGRT